MIEEQHNAFEENEISLKSQGGTEITKRSIAALVDPELASNFQIIPARVRELQDDKIRVYWLHDLAEDPEANHLQDARSRDRFHKFVFSSNWQYQQYIDKLGFPQTADSVVLETPIEPFPRVEKSRDEVRLVYFSTPHRGLELLVPVFEELAKHHDNIHLDVFSSYKLYGWEDADEKYEALFDKIRNHPNMTYHGFQPNDVLREAVNKAHILAYPSIWAETSCRVLMESMSAGLLCVHPNFAALSDTSGGLTSMYPYDPDPNKHANIFYAHLNEAINIVNTDNAQNYLGFVKSYADARFNLQKVSSQWNALLQTLLREYPTAESRALKMKQMFRYKV